MRLPAVFFVLLIVNLSLHAQSPTVPGSINGIRTLRGLRTLDNSMIAHSEFAKQTAKNLRKSSRATADSLLQWRQLYGPFGSAVRDFARAVNGSIFVCSEGGIYRSNSFGSVWEKLPLPNSSYYSVIASLFIHANGTILACGSAQIFRSTDNGNTWSVFETGVFMEEIAMDSSGKLYAASYDGGVFFSSDTGRTWASIGLKTKKLACLTVTKTGKLICGAEDALYTSADKGVSWDSVAVGDAPFISSIAQNSMGTIYVLAEDRLFSSADDGMTWMPVVDSHSLMYRFYEDEQHSLYITDWNGLHISKDGGETWQRLPVDNRLFLCMLVANKDTLMAGSFDGVVTSVDGGATWTHNDSGLVSLNIASITETHSGDLVVSAGKQIYKSTDQGGHWQSKYASQELGAVLASDSDGNLYAADAYYIRQSSDNGESWDKIIFTNNSYYCTAMVVSSARTFFVGGGNGIIFKTSEESGIWKTIFADSRGYAIRSLIIDNGGNLLCATASSVFKSVDNGSTWKEIFSSSKGWVVTTVFSTENFLFAGTYDDGLFRSADGGITWERIASISSDDPIVEIARHQNGALFASGMLDVYKSMDMGATWVSVGDGLPSGVKNNICITSKGELYLGTYSNGIYTSRSLVATVAASDPLKGFYLAQNYPNPFNPSTTIAFSIPSRSHVSLKVYDVMGRDVAMLVSENLASGNYQRQWNASGMASGMYFYRLQAGRFTETKHLLLLK